MTSGIQQLLEILTDYSTEEQQKCLEIVGRINNMVKVTYQREKKMQQDKDSNNDEQETPLEERKTETFHDITVKNKDMQ